MSDDTLALSKEPSFTPSITSLPSTPCHIVPSTVPIISTPSTSSSTTHTVLIRDSIIGFADGLTVPFALTAGLSSLGSSRLVILGGLAELFAGSISMGLGAWLAAMTDRKKFEVEEARERKKLRDGESGGGEVERVYGMFEQYGLGREEARVVVEGLRRDEEAWVRFVMDFDLQLSKPATGMACLEGVVMGISYFLGGLLPMIPYFAIRNVDHALFVSIGITIFILLVFGYVKALTIGTTQKDALLSALQTLIVGALAAATSYGIVRGVNSSKIL